MPKQPGSPTRILAALALAVAVLLAAAPSRGEDGVRLDVALRALLDAPPADAAAVLSVAATGRAAPPFPRSYWTASLGSDPGRVEVVLRARPGAHLTGAPGDLIVPLGGGRYAARVAITRLGAWVAGGILAEARLSRPVYPLLDRSGPWLGLPAVHRQDGDGGFRGATGRGVVVGIVDSGVDLYHPDFLDGAGNSRFDRYWDQGAVGIGPAGYGFGVEWRVGSIDLGVAEPRDFTGHGTHVAGIAAGNGRGSLVPGAGAVMVGGAPEATLVGVRTVFTEFAVVTGVRYVFERAGALGLPAVVNLSLGNHFGPHVGRTGFEEALDGMTGPGRLIVAAAGNSGHRDIHAEVRLAEGGIREVPLRFPFYDRQSEALNFIDIEGWFDPRDRYRFSIVAPNGEILVTTEPEEREDFGTGVRGIVRTWNVEEQGRRGFLLEIEAHPALPGVIPTSGRWTIRIEALQIAGDGEVDFWIAGQSTDGDEEAVFLDHIDREETIMVPGTARNVLTVGAVVTRECWTDATGSERCYQETVETGDVAFFSGIGPTSDGREKPEILAPGFGVLSARASTISPSVYTPEEQALLSLPDGRYWILRGTSMAAPQAAGAAALLLERFPALTPGQLTARLVDRGRAGRDDRTGRPIHLLDVAEALAPLVEGRFAEIVPRDDGLLIRWAGKERGAVEYAVYRGFSDRGPYSRLARTRISGSNPYEILDFQIEPGRTHVYRIAARDALGIEEDLDTLRVEVPGVPAFRLRPVDPNPARGSVSIRYFLAPDGVGTRYALDVLDIRGRRIRTLEDGESFVPGDERVSSWDLRAEDGRRVAPGVYWVRLRYRVLGEEGRMGSGAHAAPSALTRRVVVLP